MKHFEALGIVQKIRTSADLISKYNFLCSEKYLLPIYGVWWIYNSMNVCTKVRTVCWEALTLWQCLLMNYKMPSIHSSFNCFSLTFHLHERMVCILFGYFLSMIVCACSLQFQQRILQKTNIRYMINKLEYIEMKPSAYPKIWKT